MFYFVKKDIKTTCSTNVTPVIVAYGKGVDAYRS